MNSESSTEPRRVIWIINQYAMTPQAGMGGRHYYMAQALAAAGHEVYVVAASFTHLMRTPPTSLRGDMFTTEAHKDVKHVWVRVGSYPRAHSKLRILNWFSFAWKLRRLGRHIKTKPDFIIFSSPALIGFLTAWHLARKFKAGLVFEVRDIWPLTLVELGKFSPRHFFIRLLQWIEDFAYQRADLVISNLQNAVEHMVSRGMNPAKFCWIPNGYSMSEASCPAPLASDVLVKLPTRKFIVGYAGTLGMANAIHFLLDAAALLPKNSDVSFVLVGEGQDKARLQDLAASQGLHNVLFLPAVPKDQIQSLLSHFDALYIGWKDDPLYRFGIAPNKLPDYLFAGKPIIHSFSGFGDLVAQASSGVTVPAEDSPAIAAAILQILRLTDAERNSMGARGKAFILENFEYEVLARRLSLALERSILP